MSPCCFNTCKTARRSDRFAGAGLTLRYMDRSPTADLERDMPIVCFRSLAVVRSRCYLLGGLGFVWWVRVAGAKRFSRRRQCLLVGLNTTTVKLPISTGQESPLLSSMSSPCGLDTLFQPRLPLGGGWDSNCVMFCTVYPSRRTARPALRRTVGRIAQIPPFACIHMYTGDSTGYT